jgi:hypothetical protein
LAEVHGDARHYSPESVKGFAYGQTLR